MGGFGLIALSYGPETLFLQSLTPILPFSEMMAPFSEQQTKIQGSMRTNKTNPPEGQTFIVVCEDGWY